MGWCLARPLGGEEEHRDRGWMTRFDARFWTVDFPRPTMASVVTTAADALRVDCAFATRDALAGLIWEAEDRWDHPLLAYATDRDFSRCVLSFRWRSSGVRALDAVNGPVLTIEGRDADGNPRAWFVRLWNYAIGTPEDARVRIDFGALDGGFLLPSEADPVWAGDIDRLFISLVPPDYDAAGAAYAVPVAGWVELSELACAGSGAVLAIGDALLPQSARGIATGYDDAYNQTPERLWRQVEALGYVGPLLHYVGMSHFPALLHGGDGWRVATSGEVLSGPARAWHVGLAAAARSHGREIIWSLSYELFADYCPPAWMQRDAGGAPALTGYTPPSTLLSPANGAAMAWLRRAAVAFVGIARDAGMPVLFQIGEPWWWVATRPDRAKAICGYDAATVAALGATSVALADVRGALSAAQVAMLDALGAILAASTAALAQAVRDAAGSAGAVLHLLTYLPGPLDPETPELRRANLPPGWASPAFDVLQLEDYDWASRGQAGLSAAALALASARLGYPVERQHYLSGFVARPEDAAQWAAIEEAARRAEARGVARTYIWALPQVARDGFVHWPTNTPYGEEAVESFNDSLFPLALGREASVVAEFSTAIVTGQSGAEQRAPDWDGARLAFDVGPGLRSEADVATLIAFYRARRGPAVAFRFRDPLDAASAAVGEPLGEGDGVRTDFALVKYYGDAARRITRPVADSVAVRVNGAVASGWTLAALGVVRFAVPPVAGAVVSATFAFDVPVRFAEDRLAVSRATFLAGELTSVPLIEVREV